MNTNFIIWQFLCSHKGQKFTCEQIAKETQLKGVAPMLAQMMRIYDIKRLKTKHNNYYWVD